MSPWDLIGCVWGCRGIWLMSVHGRSLMSLTGCVNWCFDVSSERLFPLPPEDSRRVLGWWSWFISTPKISLAPCSSLLLTPKTEVGSWISCLLGGEKKIKYLATCQRGDHHLTMDAHQAVHHWIAESFWVPLWPSTASALGCCPPLPRPALCSRAFPDGQKGCNSHPQRSHHRLVSKSSCSCCCRCSGGCRWLRESPLQCCAAGDHVPGVCLLTL